MSTDGLVMLWNFPASSSFKETLFLAIHLFDDYVMTTFLTWEPRSHEPRRKAIGSRFIRTRLPGQEEICDVIIEMMYNCLKDKV